MVTDYTKENTVEQNKTFAMVVTDGKEIAAIYHFTIESVAVDAVQSLRKLEQAIGQVLPQHVPSYVRLYQYDGCSHVTGGGRVKEVLV